MCSRAERLLVILVALFAIDCASARRGGSLAVSDVKALATAPKRATAEHWRRAALAAGAIAATAAIDESLQNRSHERRNDALDDLTESITPFGGRYSDRVLMGFALAGLATRDDRSMKIAFDGLMSSILASKVVTPLLKQTVGRNRPAGDDAFAFEGGDSFPSNHATQAFAVASVIASHHDERWVDVLAYGLASAVGYARVRHEAHYASDVVAGAVIGTAIGKLVVRTNERQRQKWSVQPIAGGVSVRVSF